MDEPYQRPSREKIAAEVRASLPGATVAEPVTSWQVVFPAGLRLLSLNGREHWALRNRTYQSLRKAAWAMAKNARVPHLQRAEITAVYDPPDHRRRDPDNIAPSVKAAIDGIVAAGILPGDDSRHVTAVTCEIGQPYPRGRLRIIIRPADGEPGEAP